MSTESFAAYLHGKPKVLVKFSAKWCGPCRAMEPGLQELETDPDFPPVLRIDVEEEEAIAALYQVRAMPTLMLFAGGEPIKTQVGALSLGQLRQFVRD